MKEIQSKDLVEGQEYYDINEPFLLEPVVLKFEKHEKGCCYFSFVSGDESAYEKDSTGFIPFLSSSNFFKKD